MRCVRPADQNRFIHFRADWSSSNLLHYPHPHTPPPSVSSICVIVECVAFVYKIEHESHVKQSFKIPRSKLHSRTNIVPIKCFVCVSVYVPGGCVCIHYGFYSGNRKYLGIKYKLSVGSMPFLCYVISAVVPVALYTKKHTQIHSLLLQELFLLRICCCICTTHTNTHTRARTLHFIRITRIWFASKNVEVKLTT